MKMTVRVLHEDYVRDKELSTWRESPDLQHALRALIDIDPEHERQREDLSKGTLDPASKHYMLKKLGEQHRQRREPYVQQYIARQQQSGRKGCFLDPSTSGSSPLRG
jgi:hypothetical protein